MFKKLLRHLPGFGNVHVFWYPKDLRIKPGDPGSGANTEMKGFATYLGMIWFVANDPTARAAFYANRFRYLITPRTEMTEAMMKDTGAAG